MYRMVLGKLARPSWLQIAVVSWANFLVNWHKPASICAHVCKGRPRWTLHKPSRSQSPELEREVITDERYYSSPPRMEFCKFLAGLHPLPPAICYVSLTIRPLPIYIYTSVERDNVVVKFHSKNNSSPCRYYYLLKTGLGILDFYHFDWLNGARLSAHISAATKYGQWTLNNK